MFFNGVYDEHGDDNDEYDGDGDDDDDDNGEGYDDDDDDVEVDDDDDGDDKWSWHFQKRGMIGHTISCSQVHTASFATDWAPSFGLHRFVQMTMLTVKEIHILVDV